MKTRSLVVLLTLVVSALLLPDSVEACAVCFGAADSAMTRGMNNGILVLLGVVGVVQGGFVALFVTLWRRAKRQRDLRTQFHLVQGGAP